MTETNPIPTQQETLEPRLTMTPDELFQLHPLPWTHHLLLIKDANGKQVIHIGGVYNERNKPHEGKYLSGLNALLVELVNTRAAVAGPQGDVGDVADVLKVLTGRHHAQHHKQFDAETCPAWPCDILRAAAPADNDAESLLQHVACSGVEFDDNRMGYVVVQIDRDVWERIKKLAPTTTKGDR